jgi:hypothetical protein
VAFPSRNWRHRSRFWGLPALSAKRAFSAHGVALDERLDGDGEALGLWAVVILAVAERPGRRSSRPRPGIEGDDDLEVLGFLGAGGALAGGDAGGAEQRLVADLGDVALEDAAGERVDGDVGGLAELDVDDVGLVDLDLGGDDGHVGEGHQGRAFGVLDADDHGLALADGDVGDEAVEGSAADGLVEGVEVGSLAGDGLIDLAALESVWALAWASAACAGPGGDGDVVGGLLGVEVLLGDELVVVERGARS